MNRKNQSKSKSKNDTTTANESEQRPGRKRRGVVSKIASMFTKHTTKKSGERKSAEKIVKPTNGGATPNITTARCDFSEKTARSFRRKVSRTSRPKVKSKSPAKNNCQASAPQSPSVNSPSTPSPGKSEILWNKPSICIEKLESVLTQFLCDFEAKNLGDIFRDQWDFIEDFEVKDEKCVAFLANEEKNQAEEVECLDENRVKLERQNADQSDYIHASLVEIKEIPRKFILAQLPKLSAANREDFWMMIYQQNVHNIYLMCSSSESTAGSKEKFREYFPTANGHHEYYGQIWVHNRKVEMANESEERPVDVYTIEVYMFPYWANQDIPSSRKKLILLAAGVLSSQDTYETDPVAIISKCGAGRPGTFLALLSGIHLIKNGIVPNLKEIAHKIRTQRPGAVDTESQFVFIYVAILQFALQHVSNRELKSRTEKVFDEIEKFLQRKSNEETLEITEIVEK